MNYALGSRAASRQFNWAFMHARQVPGCEWCRRAPISTTGDQCPTCVPGLPVHQIRIYYSPVNNHQDLIPDFQPAGQMWITTEIDRVTDVEVWNLHAIHTGVFHLNIALPMAPPAVIMDCLTGSAKLVCMQSSVIVQRANRQKYTYLFVHFYIEPIGHFVILQTTGKNQYYYCATNNCTAFVNSSVQNNKQLTWAKCLSANQHADFH